MNSPPNTRNFNFSANKPEQNHNFPGAMCGRESDGNYYGH